MADPEPRSIRTMSPVSTARDLVRRAVQDDRFPDQFRTGAVGVRNAARWASRRQRALPDFIIIGTHKGGTTALYDYIAAHPQVVPSLEKEVHYFDRDYDGDPDTYRVQFPVVRRMERIAETIGRPTITGEASPYYLAYPHTPPRARAMVPDAKFIALLRDPVTRVVSAFHHNRKRTPYEPLTDLAEAIERERTLFADEIETVRAHERYSDFNYAKYCYLRRSVYVEHLQNWHQHFPREQLLVLQSEKLSSEPAETFARVTEFLGIDDWQPPSFPPSNTNSYPDIDAGLRADLTEWFRPHNERLYEYLGERFDWTE